MALGVAGPALVKTSTTDLESNARILAAGLRSVREKAIAGNRAVALILDLQAPEMILGEAADGHQPVSRSLSAGIRYKLYTAQSEWLSDRRGGIRFFPDGSSTGGRVTLSSERAVMLVDVDWLTGRVRVLDGTEQDLMTSGEAVAVGS